MNFASTGIRSTLCIFLLGVFLLGCRTAHPVKPPVDTRGGPASLVRQYPPSPVSRPSDLQVSFTPELQSLPAPPTLSSDSLPESFWDISLDEAISLALSNRTVLGGLGGQLLGNPDAVPTTLDPAIQGLDPNFGIQAALAQFDAQYASNLTFARNDNVFNNLLSGGGTNEVQQKLITSQTNLTKTSATGATFSLRTDTISDNNNAPNNLFDNSWTTLWEVQARRPLLQGAGIEFNRIAGPNARPGLRFSNGVIIAQTNYEISAVQFESSLQQFVGEIVVKYWQLQVAYQQFQSLKEARDASLKVWNMTKARQDAELLGGEADREAEAREQYFSFEAQVLAALNGDQASGEAGVLKTEGELRRLIGLPNSDGRLLRPADVPAGAGIVFEWHELVQSAFEIRPDVRQQSLKIRERELELVAAKNFLLPRFDAVTTYRKNGFGDDLLGGGPGRFSSAYKDLYSGQHDEWEAGLQLQVPIGYRQAHAGVRQAELNLRRAMAVQAEQKAQIGLDLGAAVRQVDHSEKTLRIMEQRLSAALETTASRQAAFDAGTGSLLELLDSQRRLADAEIAYYRTLANVEMAVESVFRESGLTLHSHNILVSERNEIASTGISRKTNRKLTNPPMDFRLNR